MSSFAKLGMTEALDKITMAVPSAKHGRRYALRPCSANALRPSQFGIFRLPQVVGSILEVLF